jgi:membrane-associated phospholipid phosphatase
VKAFRAALVLAALWAPGLPAFAEQPAGTRPAAARSEAAPETTIRRDDGVRTLRGLPVNLGRGLIGVFHVDNLAPAMAGATATAAASFFDGRVREVVVNPFAWGDTFETAGGPVYSTIVVAGMFTAGRFVQAPRFRAMTYDMLDSAVVAFAYTSALKEVVGRERPNGQDHKSFPSGHTANAFALAVVAQHHYGWKVGVPAYALAGLMGASRVNQDKHWVSDVFAGATLGYVAGRTVVRVNGRAPARAAATWNVSPVLARHVRGLQVSVVF